MGVRVANRSKRPPSSPLWEVSYHLPSTENGALSPSDAPDAPMPLKDDPAVLQERERLQKRRELIGRNVRIPREWADVLNVQSPVALQPRFGWLEWADSQCPKVWHDELRWFRWATVLEDGTVIKGYTEKGVEAVKDTVLRCQPLMREFGLVVPVFYQNHGWKWAGGCSPEEEFEGITIPRTIILSDKDGKHDMTFSLIHELAHIAEGPIPQRPWRRGKETRRDYQRSLHTEKFRRVHGQLLSYYLEHHADYWEDRALRYWAETNSYSPPIHPDGGSW